MSVEKICPFMSRPDGTSDPDGGPRVAAVPCQGDRCAAWEKHAPVDEYDTFEGGRCRLIP